MINKLIQMLTSSSDVIHPSPVDIHVCEDGCLISKSGFELLQDASRKQFVRQLWDLTSLTHESFELHVEQPIQRFAEIVQLLPASENHHHSYSGGLLDHTLEVAIYALKIRRNMLLPPGGKSEEQAKVADIWTTAVIYGALFHDIGKVAFDMKVETVSGGELCLIHGNIPIGTQYAISYVKGRNYQVHSVSGLLFLSRILTQVNIDWIRSEVDVFNFLVMEFSGHHDKSGVIGEIVKKADKASVSKYMGGNPSVAIEQSVDSLQGKLLSGLRYIVKNRLKLNVKGASCFITDDGIWLVSKIVANDLRSYLLELGFNGVPASNPILFDQMQSYGIALPNAQGKAVWNCKLSIDDWSANLTFLKVHHSTLWSDPSDLPQLLAGTVEPCDDVIDNSELNNEIESRVLKAASNISSVEDSKVSHSQVQDSDQSIHSNYMDMFDDLGMTECTQIEMRNESSGNHETGYLETAAVKSSNEAEGQSANCSNSTLGAEFLDWLFTGINSKKLIINDAKALAHSLEDSLFIVSPKSFQRFCIEKNGDDGNWKDVQKAFQKCKVHQKSPSSLNIIKVKVQGVKRTAVIQGYLLKKECNRSKFLYNNPFLSVISEEL